eukprot:g664.t1
MRGIFLLLCCIASTHGAIDADEVKSLPGWSATLPSKQYSGYLQVGTKHLHYWLVLSEGNPATDPVTLWLNGGPGCSSLDGYLYEQGPFHADEADPTHLYYNNYTWAKKSSMLYLEAPAGVGFSYSDNWRDYATNDTDTADTSRQALVQFFEKYPELSKNDFYITGESYAGVYVPTLAYSILTHAESAAKINLKGIAVGNGCTGSELGVNGPGSTGIAVEYLHMHGLYSDATHDAILKACGNPVAAPPPRTQACNAALDAMSDEVGNINIYNIYGQCTHSPQESEVQLKVPVSHALLGRTKLGGPNACIDSSAGGAWINRDVTRSALHLHMPPAPSGNWSTCGNNITYTSTMKNEPKEVYPLLVAKLRVLIYNGDADACVPYTDNEQWTSAFAASNNIKELKPWHSWTTGDEQVAGYATTYAKANGFSFVTVRGAGHMVPQVKPKQALSMFEKFLAGNTF